MPNESELSLWMVFSIRNIERKILKSHIKYGKILIRRDDNLEIRCSIDLCDAPV